MSALQIAQLRKNAARYLSYLTRPQQELRMARCVELTPRPRSHPPEPPGLWARWPWSRCSSGWGLYNAITAVRLLHDRPCVTDAFSRSSARLGPDPVPADIPQDEARALVGILRLGLDHFSSCGAS